VVKLQQKSGSESGTSRILGAG